MKNTILSIEFGGQHLILFNFHIALFQRKHFLIEMKYLLTSSFGNKFLFKTSMRLICSHLFLSWLCVAMINGGLLLLLFLFLLFLLGLVLLLLLALGLLGLLLLLELCQLGRLLGRLLGLLLELLGSLHGCPLLLGGRVGCGGHVALLSERFQFSLNEKEIKKFRHKQVTSLSVRQPQISHPLSLK